ncbi:MAG: class I SAM-dependent methyltransferase [Rhodobacteraceae bacterium]|nr:class I SAM-dependent methyltransferase [Paracoccaceae bacterium]
MLQRWSGAINLVARPTLQDVWTRHILDSAQLWALRPARGALWADLGAGAGFPGLVIAAIAAEQAPGMAVALVESDQRKCAFLRSAAREMGLAPAIHTARAEVLPPLGADVVSARALAPLPLLWPMVRRHLAPGASALLPKGARAGAELAEALALWPLAVQKTQSWTDPNAVVLTITEQDGG